jgi:uncharacterized membrane protein (DUF106 family)
MSRTTFLSGLLDPVLNPMLKLGPMWALILVSFLLTLIVTLIYKFVTNQELLGKLKKDLKKLQKDMKELKDHPQKMMKKQKEMWAKNMEYMRHSSFKSMLFTIIPVLIVFGWLSAHLAYEPLIAGEEFNVTLELSEVPTTPPEAELPQGLRLVEGYPKGNGASVVFSFVGEAGNYISPPLRLSYANQSCDVPIIIAENVKAGDYTYPQIKCDASKIDGITVSNKQLRPLSPIGLRVTWFWAYIILSVVFSMVLRKILNVH